MMNKRTLKVADEALTNTLQSYQPDPGPCGIMYNIRDSDIQYHECEDVQILSHVCHESKTSFS
jgi:hypothetical protein